MDTLAGIFCGCGNSREGKDLDALAMPEFEERPATVCSYPLWLLEIGGLSGCTLANLWRLNIFMVLIQPLKQVTRFDLALMGGLCFVAQWQDRCAQSSGCCSSAAPLMSSGSGRAAAYFVVGSLTAVDGGLTGLAAMLQLGVGLALTSLGVVEGFKSCCRSPDPFLEAVVSTEWFEETTPAYVRALTAIGLIGCTVVTITALLHAKSIEYAIEHLFSILTQGEILIFLLLGLEATLCKGRCTGSKFPMFTSPRQRGVAYFVLGTLSAAAEANTGFVSSILRFGSGLLLAAMGVKELCGEREQLPAPWPEVLE